MFLRFRLLYQKVTKEVQSRLSVTLSSTCGRYSDTAGDDEDVNTMKKTKYADSMKISVVVPVYNAARTLRPCLQALKDQTDSNYEVIIVDDASSDISAEIYREFDFKVIRLEKNKGQAIARNEGVKNASGELIAFVDSDVIVSENWLKKYRMLLSLYADADMICSGYGTSVNSDEPALFAFYETLYRRLNISLYIDSSTSSNCILYRKSFEEVGGYPEYYLSTKERDNRKAVATNEDGELGFLLSAKGKKIVWSADNPVSHYFRDSWKGYLKQQVGFSSYAVLSVFKFPGILNSGTIYNDEKIMPQLVLAFMIIFSTLGLFLGPAGVLITIFIMLSSLACFYFLNKKFILFIKSNMKEFSFPHLFFWIVLSRFAWLYGVTLGLKNGLIMLWNNTFKT